MFLTKNGRRRYALVDIADYYETQASVRLMGELAKGWKSGEQKGWLSIEDVRVHFREKTNESIALFTGGYE